MAAAAHAGDCGCCGAAATSREPRNPPGQHEISHRAGTYGSFLARMQRLLAHQPGLRALTTRDPSDPVIALLEAWASVAEVLAFQAERYAQEGFLRTSTTRDAVLLHARALGYELRPGVAASSHLALSLELADDAPDEVLLAAGIAVQSVPGPDELPQVFETVAELLAVRGLDDLRPARAELVVPGAGDDEVVLDGTATGLRPGDRLLVVGAERLAGGTSGRWDLRRVVAVTPVEAETTETAAVPAHTRVRLESPLAQVDPAADPGGAAVEVHALRQGVPLFGHAAPPWAALPVALRVGELEPGSQDTVLAGAYSGRASSWVDAPLPAAAVRLELSRRVDALVADSWAVIASPDHAELLRVTGVAEEPLADYLLTAEASVLTVPATDLGDVDRRSALVWCASEALPLGARPMTAAVEGSAILLDRAVAGLAPGRTVLVEGVRADTGEPAAELAEVSAVDVAPAPGGAGTVTALGLTQALGTPYRRDDVHLRGNVVAATHGQRREVVLGAGDGTAAFQRFVLPEAELTHVPPDLAADPSPAEVLRGAASSLEVRVDGTRWQQVASLHGQPGDARVYTARARPGDGRVELVFGDGRTGARLPSGGEVRAAYRVGVGLDGRVAAEQLSLLLSRPLGLTGARNPLPAEGGAEPEPLEEARRNAPVGVRTLGRVVSLDDVASSARTYGGVAKAAAAWLWVGDERVVHVTVAPADGTALAADDPLLAGVAAAIDGARHPGPPIVVSPHRDVPVGLRAGVVPDPDAVAATVLDAADAAVRTAFAAAARDLAEPLAAAEVLAVLHEVDGVVAVLLERFHPLAAAPGLDHLVPARPATVLHGEALAAELVWLADVELVEAGP